MIKNKKNDLKIEKIYSSISDLQKEENYTQVQETNTKLIRFYGRKYNTDEIKIYKMVGEYLPEFVEAVYEEAKNEKVYSGNNKLKIIQVLNKIGIEVLPILEIIEKIKKGKVTDDDLKTLATTLKSNGYSNSQYIKNGFQTQNNPNHINIFFKNNNINNEDIKAKITKFL